MEIMKFFQMVRFWVVVIENIPERVQWKLSVYPKKIRSYLRKT